MHEINCAVCRKKNRFKVLYKANFKETDITPSKYISRRLPDKLHFRIVRCQNCGLTFSNPIVENNKILKSYKNSDTYPEEDIEKPTDIYEYYMKSKILLNSNSKILEIGCGNGRFLSRLYKLGHINVFGVEPSKNAVLAFPKVVDKSKIIIDFFKDGQFKRNSFDVVVFFQVLDHVIDPNKFIKNVYRVLKPGGQVLAIVHNSYSWSAKLFGEKSPIFDIQYIYLFDKKNLRQIFKNNGFKINSVFPTFTKYSVAYWFKMIPLRMGIKKIFYHKFFHFLNDIDVKFIAGNMGIVAYKPTKER
jgi:SAM-dependent methyltransferase